MIKQRRVLIAGELAVLAKRSKVEPVAVTVEVVFGEVFVVIDGVVGADVAGAGPGARFDLDEFDVG